MTADQHDPERSTRQAHAEAAYERLFGPRDAGIWVFTVDGEDPVTVPAGEFVARRLTRNPRFADDQKIELWLAPALGYLPVRIRQTQTDGDIIDMQLREAPESSAEK